MRGLKVEGLTLTLVGPIALLRDGVAVPLPSSRKTRALPSQNNDASIVWTGSAEDPYLPIPVEG